MDPASFVAEHSDRVGAVHLKDLLTALGRESRGEAQDCHSAIARHIWTEPGRGDIDLPAVLAGLSHFDGWFVVEVDLADQPTPRQSAQVSAQWVKQHLVGGERASA